MNRLIVPKATSDFETTLKEDNRLERITSFNESNIEINRLCSNSLKIGIDPKTGLKLIDKHYRNNIEKNKKIPKDQ